MKKGFFKMATEGWTVDKRVPLALIGGFIFQGIVSIIIAVTFFNNTGAHFKSIDETQLRDEMTINANHKDVQDLSVLTNNVNTHMAVNDEKLRNIDDKLATLIRSTPVGK